ncbi:hypothetical protein BCR35DRAFT_3313 [Leucosporidium creatinivorum]|uniref:F-box domain-containing protein n=1 Tax=Leucosporidium creatinivorum TaxID=106004 RepID=A0A1Y2G7J4_9BASI|nr:hypothetical protein BCR35DRAFT_3313 [Leucosporidium creatinivorum]
MFDTGSQVTTFSLRDLVWRCSKLQALQFTSASVSMDVPFWQLAVDTPDIQDLALDYCRIILASPSGAISLHHVRRLYLSSLHRPNSTVGALLLALEAPSLDTLFILDITESSPDSKDLENAVCKFAPRLRTFGVTLTDGMTLAASTWSSFTILKSLTLSHEEGLADLSKHLPTALDQLRIRPFAEQSSTFAHLLATFRNPPSSLASLQTLSIPPVAPFGTSADERRASMANRDEVVRICNQRGVEVQEVLLFYDGGYPDFMEDMLDC